MRMRTHHPADSHVSDSHIGEMTCPLQIHPRNRPLAACSTLQRVEILFCAQHFLSSNSIKIETLGLRSTVLVGLNYAERLTFHVTVTNSGLQ